MTRISRKEVEHIAALARLSLSEEEVGEMTGELDQVLDYVTALQSLETQGIEPTAHAIALSTALRPDAAGECMDPALALATAPESQGSAFLVPKVIDGEDAS